MKRLAEEEKNGKDMLDEKLRLQQELAQLAEEMGDQKAMHVKNREEIIKQNIRSSQLTAAEDKSITEYERLKKENDFYIKKNAEFEKENVELNKEIQQTIQKIDINTLLKEVDMEDMKLISQNNKQMNSALHNLISKWEQIQKLEA